MVQVQRVFNLQQAPQERYQAKEAVKAANNADALLIEKDGQAEDGKSVVK